MKYLTLIIYVFFFKGMVMKNQVLSLLCGISFLVSSPVFGMEPDKTESKAIVTRLKFLVKKPDASVQPLEWLFHEGVFKQTVINSLSPDNCRQLLMTSKNLYNWFVPYMDSFTLGVRLDDSLLNGTNSLLIETSKNSNLSLAGRRFSLCFSTQKTIDQNLPPIQLCSFSAPSRFGQVAYCLSNKAYQPISYFPELHGEPKQLFLQGVPKEWQSYSSTPYGIQCGNNPDLWPLAGKKLKLMLEGAKNGESPYFFHQNLFRLNGTQPETLDDTTPMVKKETKEEGFARLRPQIIQMIDAAISREDIARTLQIPEDLIEEILNGQAQPIVEIEEESSEDESVSLLTNGLNFLEDLLWRHFDSLIHGINNDFDRIDHHLISVINRIDNNKQMVMFAEESSEDENTNLFGYTSNIFENFPDENLTDEMHNSEQMLTVEDEFNKDDDDASLFSQIIQLKNEAWDNDEIALYLRISADEVDEILNSQR